MAGALIDASLRRASLLAEARGFTVPDTQPLQDPTPQVIIEGDDEEIFLNFNDGLGYTTDKNAYRNYGYSFIWTHNGKIQYSASSQALTEDLDDAFNGALPSFNELTGKYESTAPKGAGALEIQSPVDRTYTFFPELPVDVTITGTFASIEAGTFTATFPSGAIPAGSPLEVVVTGTNSASSYLLMQISFTYDLGTG